VDIELARTFLAVVETGSFLDAAEKVHVTQSTVSTRIRSLEEQLGHPVFERSRAGATLTPAGRHFERHAVSLVRTWAQARVDAGMSATLQSGLHIGAAPSLWEGFLIEVLPDVMSAFADVSIRASYGTSDDLERQLLDGGLDLAILYRPRLRAGLSVLQLFEDAFVLVSSDISGTQDPFGPDYVLIDWGPEFRADHALNFPDLAPPHLQLGLGALGLQYLRRRVASGYFPQRLVGGDIARGRLRMVDEAPRFAYAAYAVFGETQEESVAGLVAAMLQRQAAELTG
jgi:DNA-binding transcriptional LysR family regulator